MSDLTFDPVLHEYRIGGARVPGVTQILAPLSDFSGVPRDMLEAKRDLGQRVHLACQLHDEDDLDEETVEPDVQPYLAAWRRFLLESGARVIHNERQVRHMGMLYAGTLDNVLELDGRIWLVDKKTSLHTPAAAGPQTAAYMRALDDPSVTHRAAIRLRPDGTYRFDPLSGADDWSVFVACLTLMRFRERHAA